MSKYAIQGHPRLGWPYAWRAGRPWPNAAIVAEVVDGDADPEPPPRLATFLRSTTLSPNAKNRSPRSSG